MTDYKLMPMEPTEEVLDAIRFRVGSIDRDEADEIYYLIMTTSPDVHRHPATPSFLEYPSFEESANFDPVPAPKPVDDGLFAAVKDVADKLATSRVYERWQAVEDLRDALAAHRKGEEV